MAKVTDPIEVARRMAESISSDLHAFIFSNKLVDSGMVKRIIALAGVDRLLERYARGEIIVYYVKRDPIFSKCMHDDCADASSESKEACVADCFARSIEEVSRRAAESIIEAGKTIAETLESENEEP